jgi:hypothetical protein
MISEQKLKAWTDIFLAYVREKGPEYHVIQEEGYKFKAVDTFQKNFDINAPDLVGMLERSIEHNNLVAGSNYLPRRMLLILAQEHPEETRQALKTLFTEGQSNAKRINAAKAAFDAIMSKRNAVAGEEAHTYIGIRFLSLLLGFHFPNECNAIKPAEWKVFCKYVDEDFAIPNGTLAGDRYAYYEPHIDALRNYIRTIPAVQGLREQLTRGLAFKDEEFRWMAQDVIYVTARRFAKDKDEAGEKPTTAQKDRVEEDIIEEESDTSEGAEMRFPLEKYLEHFIVDNWDSIDFGEPLELYREDDGTPGQQYTTDVGIIDILAKDKKGNFVVIELKRGKSSQHVMGQVLAYIGWVRRNLATEGQGVRGIVIVSEGNEALLEAQKEISDKVAVKYYRVNLEIIDPK